MTKYKSRPEIVDAVQWNKPGDHPEVELVEGRFYHFIRSKKLYRDYVVAGDYIITHSNGSITVMSEQEFLSKYEKAEDDSACPECRGTKMVRGCIPVPCARCGGTGKVEEEEFDGKTF